MGDFEPDVQHIERRAVNNNALTDYNLVLDLDQTLIYSNENMDTLKELGIMTSRDPRVMALKTRVYVGQVTDAQYRGDGVVRKFWGLKRPFLNEFLLSANSIFKHVIVWSAAEPRYVEEIVRIIFQDLPAPYMVFTAEQTEELDGTSIKPLSKLYATADAVAGGIDETNTLILDDLKLNFRPNPDNGVLIPKYGPPYVLESLLQDKDSALLQFRGWILQPKNMRRKDVRELIRARPDIFGTTVAEYNKMLTGVPGHEFVRVI